VTSALDAVIDAALERALVDTSDARRYFALAGALDRVRVAETAGEGDDSLPEHPVASQGGRTAAEDGPLSAALLTTVAIGALGSTTLDGIDPEAWSPGGHAGEAHLVAAGAAAACRRFDVEADRVAVRSGIPRERIWEERGRTEHGR
jgi:hypothetical protein